MIEFSESNKAVKKTLIILLITSVSAFSQLPLDSIKFIIKRAVENKRCPGMVVGIINEKGKQVFGYGKINGNNTQQADENTLYDIGSVTKIFTSLVLADMVSKGELNLNDPISKFLPKSVKVPIRNGREITLLDLATHTSGLPRQIDNSKPKDLNNPYADYTTEKLYDFLSHYTLTRDIGSKYEYSNIGVGLLGHILTLVAGKDYETLVIKRICEPLKMNSTLITLTLELRKRFATGHDADGNVVKNWDFSALAPCGALRSTLSDLLTYAEANMGLMKTNLEPAIKLTHHIRDSINPELYMGLGWHIWKKFGKQIYWHDGNVGGYYAYFGFDLKHKTAVVVLSNSDNRIDDIALHILDRRFPVNHLEKIVSVPDSVLKKYAGIYKKDDGTIRVIAMKDSNLWFKSPSQGISGKMHFTSNIDYFTYLFPNEHSIYVDNLGKVIGLMSKGKGGSLFAKRVDSLDLSFDGYNGLAWDALEAKDYNSALLYLQRGLKKDSSNLFLLGNLAHTYLFTGNYTKAIEIYKKHLGQNLNNNFSWEEMIKSDFTTLKADGLPIEPMDKVLKELNL